ncbi:FAD-binding protein [Alphaproteobacteria bacterium HT1-32]|nr:FAD-binding protein [Alphaproteobacteria bacterium HT1-32]
MTVQTRIKPGTSGARPGDSALSDRLRRETNAEVLFDGFSRGRYSTDASIYQIEPIGVIVPRSVTDIEAAITIGREQGIPILPRGAGTSQCGQTVGEALVIDTSKYLRGVVSFDKERRRVRVQPGIVLNHLNAWLKPHGLFYPVDVSPANRATIGGMTGNNSCGSRSIRYGNMVHNVREIDAILADGTRHTFGDIPGNLEGISEDSRYLDILMKMRRLHAREATEIADKFPKLLRRVGGYNIDSIDPRGHNMAHLLVGSEGTLGFFSEIELDLQEIPAQKALGVCHFPTFFSAMDTTQHIVKLGPSAVELVDRTIIELGRQNAEFRPVLDRCIQGEPDSLLLVEFAGDDRNEQLAKLDQLEELMADHGFPNAVVRAEDPSFQQEIWSVRAAGLNIVMSMKGDGKPVSFIEDCAVPLEDLAEYTDRLNQLFRRHGTEGTWYAHASVGTLHVRPILNMKTDEGAKKMRAVAEEAFAIVREYKGSHSGEHGDGLVRSEFHEPMFGSRIARAFEEVKDTFDPDGLFNPGKIVRPEKMDDRNLHRYKPGYAPLPLDTVLDWAEWGGFSSAVEMCNNNGTCRKSNPGVMCPSFRATDDERHVTRGRANSLRLAITGQLGPDAFTSDDMKSTMELCVGCKGCKRECPTGVDMAKMKIEFLHAYKSRHGLTFRDRLVAWLPRYARGAAKVGWLLNLRDKIPGLAALSEKVAGLSARRRLPQWSPRPYEGATAKAGSGPTAVLFSDCFNTWFEPENARAAEKVLKAADVNLVTPKSDGRPLCCGRTFLSAGLVDEAKAEARRTIDALLPLVEQGATVVGLEPSCLFTLRDEFRSMLPGDETGRLAEASKLFEAFIVEQTEAGKISLDLQPIAAKQALLHGHCHQKAFGAMSDVQKALGMVPELEHELIQSSCCGMAGNFGYEAEHYDVSMKMGELDLLPKVRAAEADTLIVADGTSCRHQVADGTEREAVHVARVLEQALRQ